MNAENNIKNKKLIEKYKKRVRILINLNPVLFL